MSKSTPLNQLPAAQNRSDIVQDVLDDLDDEMHENFEPDYEEIDEQHQNRYRDYQHDQAPLTHFKKEGQVSQDGGSQSHNSQMIEPFQGLTLSQIVWEELKSPLLFILLFVLLNWKTVDKLVLSYLPEGGMTGTYSLLVRALVGAILFYLVRTFLLPMF